MAVFLFFLMVALYLAVGVASKRYTPGSRRVLLAVSTFIPAAVLASWQIS